MWPFLIVGAMAVAQIFESDPTEPQTRFTFRQVNESAGPVPACDNASTCVCPDGYMVQERQNPKNSMVTLIECVVEKESDKPATTRAPFDHYRGKLPQNYNFGK